MSDPDSRKQLTHGRCFCIKFIHSDTALNLRSWIHMKILIRVLTMPKSNF